MSKIIGLHTPRKLSHHPIHRRVGPYLNYSYVAPLVIMYLMIRVTVLTKTLFMSKQKILPTFTIAI